MRRRSFLFLFFTTFLLFIFTIPFIAEGSTRFSHQAEYRVGGLIRIDKEIGDPCTTGASKTQNIIGYGELTKSENIQIAPHIMSLEDKIDWTTAEDAIRNLSITSTIELCARPLSVAAETFEDQIFGEDAYELSRKELSLFEFMYYAYQEELSAEELYGFIETYDWTEDGIDYSSKVSFEVFEEWYDAVVEEWTNLGHPEDVSITKFIEWWHVLENEQGEDPIFGILDPHKLVEVDIPGTGWVTYGTDIKEGDVISPYHPLVVAGELAVRSKTTQTWGNYISPNQGEQGAYVSDFIAAYGPGPYDGDTYDDIYTWEYDEEKNKAADKGDRYVGNFFDIDSYVYTSGGDARRYISMSSPFSKTLLEETMDVTGMVEVTETFSLDNLEAGPDAITLAWHELF